MIKEREIAGCNIHYRFYTLEDFFSHQQRFGIRRVDLFGATPHVWIDAYSAADGRKIRSQMEEYGLEPGMFVPEFTSMRYSLGSEGESGRKTWEYIRRCFHFARELGTDQVVISASGFLLDQDEKKRFGRLEEALGRLGRLAGEYGLMLYLMNHYADCTDMVRSMEDMERCMEICGSIPVFPAVDTASVYEAGERLEDWLECFGEKIRYVNLSNTKFDGSRHYWGDGYLNLHEIVGVLERFRYHGAVGTSYMLRDYLARPWEADERTREMLTWVCGQKTGCQKIDGPEK